MTDSFSSELPEWLEAIPGPVDAPVEAMRQRLGRVSRQMERVLAEVADRRGLSVGDLETLSVLARSSAGSVTPSRLGQDLGLSSGTVSVRLERLTTAGMVEVVPGSDGRSRPVRLTSAGRQAWGEATLARTAVEREAVTGVLDPGEIEQLSDLLSRVLARFEERYGPAPRHDMTRGRRSVR